MALSVDIRKKLSNFELKVRFEAENEVLALLGASGSGKSVTLRCIAGIMTPDEGRIVLDERTLFDSEKHIDLVPGKRGVGYLFQQYALFPNMTVRQNVECVVPDKKSKAKKAGELLRRFQLENVQTQRPASLSGGQQQRAALARILATEPEILLLDEPFSALDSFLKSRLEQELRDTLDAFGGSVIWVSHDRDEVFRNCQRVCVVDAGASQRVVTPAELFTSPGTVAAAKLSGCNNLLRAETRDSGVYLPEWGVELKCAKSESANYAGLRAHHFTFCRESDENAIACELVRTMDNVFSKIYIFKPKNSAPGATTLRMETESKKEKTGPFFVNIAPENVLLLKEEDRCSRPPL